jgi:hypothetical protein
MSLPIFHQKQIKSFHHFWKPLLMNQLNFFRMSMLWIEIKIIFVFEIALKFQKFCMKTTLCQTFLHIASSPNPNWTLGGHDQVARQSKTHCRVGSMIPFLKILGRVDNPWDKGMSSKTLLEVQLTWCDLSKQEWKSHQSLLPSCQLLSKERHHEEMGAYISQVSIHAYQS